MARWVNLRSVLVRWFPPMPFVHIRRIVVEHRYIVIALQQTHRSFVHWSAFCSLCSSRNPTMLLSHANHIVLEMIDGPRAFRRSLIQPKKPGNPLSKAFAA